MKILITGGPVYDYLDSVKIITNKFKGRSIAELADCIHTNGIQVTYLCSRGSEKPKHIVESIIYHDGFDDYKNKVLELAPKHDVVILGAAVCNLIPQTPWKNRKFPSHNYKEGDKVAIDFIVAPRIINMIKQVAPRTTLIGFKLLDGVDHEELVEAAYDILIDSKASFVVANDAKNILKKFIITKEKSVIPIDGISNLANFICKAAHDIYYTTELLDGNILNTCDDHILKTYHHNISIRADAWKAGYDKKRNMYFGCLAIRYKDGFIISTRGKTNINVAPTYVEHVDHDKKIIRVYGEKASLNAPLIDKLFKAFPDSSKIVHTHNIDLNLPLYPYAFPGTVEDACRNIKHKEFNIEHHGSFYVF